MSVVEELQNSQVFPLMPSVHEDGTITLANSEGDSGWFGLRFYVVVDGAHRFGVNGQVAHDAREISWTGAIAPGVEVVLTIAPSPTGQGIAITPILRNFGDATFAFSGYGFAVAEDAAGPSVAESRHALPVYAHSENLRYEKLPHCRMTYPFIRPLPEHPTQIGTQASSPIPALFMGLSGHRRWLVEGALTQERHLLTWQLGLPTTDRQLDYQSVYTWNGGADEVVQAGETVTLESTLYLLLEGAADTLFAPYIRELTTQFGDRFAGSSSRLAQEPVYCTWNFGAAENITEADCLRRMDVVASVQGGGFFQIDHGYQRPYHPGELSDSAAGTCSPDSEQAWDVDVFYPEPQHAWGFQRFPSGAESLAAACRARGLRPAIWFSPRVNPAGPLIREHPEWILRNHQGTPIHVGHYCLDPSVPDVRAFLESCIDTLTHVWGFEGIKLDFFSYMFDHENAVFRYGGTGVAWKHWFTRSIRRALGPRGYFVHCISASLGNPFLALEGCDAYRASYDVDPGAWENHTRSSHWIMPGALANTRQTWFMNLDSILGHPDIPAIERRSRGAFAYLTGGMFEFSGLVEGLDAEILDDYRRLVERLDQGQGGIRCPDTSALTGRPLPAVLARHHAPDSQTRRRFGIDATVGLFNWDDVAKPVSVMLATVGIPVETVTASDFWSGAPVGVDEGVITAKLAPRGHLLVDITYQGVAG